MRAAFATIICYVLACGPGGRDHGACDPNTFYCDGIELETCVDGTFTDSMMCAQACSAVLGACTTCVPNAATCSGNVAHECNADGTGFVDEVCDPLKGETCDPTQGCTGPCSEKALGLSYIGCDYYPTVTGNIVGNDFDFAVAISNTSANIATITIDGGALTTPQTVMVQPGKLVVLLLLWFLFLFFFFFSETQMYSSGCQSA